MEDLGLFRDGVFVFTSDHGEEFLEHGGLMHSGAAHEEVARVPLFLFGGGIEPGDVRLGASLVDVAPTLAGRSGIPRPPRWVGADLLGMDRERTLFVCTRNVDRRLLGIVRGSHKLLAEASPEVELPRDVRAAFDLSADPREQTDLRGAASWPDELARAARGPWEAVRAPLLPAEAVQMDPGVLEEMRALGYGE
jgi:arylsulfatase A-like enzyme